MELKDALTEDILAVLPPRSSQMAFISLYRIIEAVAPRREKEVREAIRELVRRGWLEMSRHGNGVPAYYARTLTRRT